MSSKMLVVLFIIAFVGSALSSPVLPSDSLPGGQSGPSRVPEDLLRALIALQPANETGTDLEPRRSQEDDNDFDCECGVKGAGNRIVGGQVAGVKEWPWQAYLLIDDSSECGGTVLSRKWVITAAHCTAQAKKVMVYLGLYKADDPKTAKHITRASLIINHENHVEFPDGTQLNDLALLKLRTPVLEFDSFIRPICLPYPIGDTAYNGDYATVTGWGDTAEFGSSAIKLRELSVPVLGSDKCSNKPYRYKTGTVTEDMLCTYTEGEDTCQGDGGGPLSWLSPKNSRMYLIGVVSFGKGCARKNYPTVYMKMINYLKWIRDQTDQEFCILKY